MAASTALNDTKPTVRELQPGRGVVFNFDIFVDARLAARGDFRHIARQPQQKVNRVHALIHERAAAIERPGATPSGARVVLLRAPPGNVGRTLAQATKAALFHGASGSLRARPETALENRAELDTLAKALLEYETLSGDEIKTLLGGGSIDRGGSAKPTIPAAGSSVPKAPRKNPPLGGPAPAGA